MIDEIHDVEPTPEQLENAREKMDQLIEEAGKPQAPPRSFKEHHFQKYGRHNERLNKAQAKHRRATKLQGKARKRSR